MLAVYKKELRSFFINPVGYVFVGVFLTLAAGLCAYTTLESASYDTSSYFYFLLLSMIVIIPLLTMRLFSEERKMKTEQMLLTAPVSIFYIVIGKFLAAFTMFGGSLILSLVNLIPLYIIGKQENDLVDWTNTNIGPVTSEIVGSVLGILLAGAAFVALGMFISALTENQLSAAVLTIAALLVMLILNVFNNIGSEAEGTRLVNNYVLRYVIDWVSLISRFTMFQNGILDWSALLYYISFSFIFVYLTVRVYERRRWA